MPRLNPNPVAEWDAKQGRLLAELVHEHSGDWSRIALAFDAATPAHISRSAGKLSVHWRRIKPTASRSDDPVPFAGLDVAENGGVDDGGESADDETPDDLYGPYPAAGASALSSFCP